MKNILIIAPGEREAKAIQREFTEIYLKRFEDFLPAGPENFTMTIDIRESQKQLDDKHYNVIIATPLAMHLVGIRRFQRAQKAGRLIIPAVWRGTIPLSKYLKLSPNEGLFIQY